MSPWREVLSSWSMVSRAKGRARCSVNARGQVLVCAASREFHFPILLRGELTDRPTKLRLPGPHCVDPGQDPSNGFVWSSVLVK